MTKSLIRLIECRVNSCGDKHLNAFKMFRVELFLKNRLHRQACRQKTLARLTHLKSVRTLLCRAKPNRGLRNKHGNGVRNATIAGREKVVNGRNIARRVLESRKGFGRYGRWIQRTIGELLGEPRGAVLLFPEVTVGAAIPLKIVSAIKSARIFRENACTMTRAS